MLITTAKLMSARFTTVRVLSAGVRIRVVFDSYLISASKNPNMKSKLFSTLILDFALVKTTALFALLMTFLMPILYSRAGDATDQVRREGVDNVIKNVAMMGFCSTLLATLFTFVFHELIFEILVSENYRSISQYLPLMVLSGGIFGIALVISGRFFAFLSPVKMIPASIGSSIIGIISAFICTYYFSVLGAVFAMLLHSLAFLILTLVTKINPIENK